MTMDTVFLYQLNGENWLKRTIRLMLMRKLILV
jgi:hypothetical protein